MFSFQTTKFVYCLFIVKINLNLLAVIISGFLILTAFQFLSAQQPLETETARLVKAKKLEIESSFEFQTSSEGTEKSLPFAIIYGIRNDLELMIEPVAYTSINPKAGVQAHGPGDIEITLSYLFRHESGHIPALSVAGEVKIPTAKDKLIGTQKYDYAGYIVASKRFGRFDTHINLGYTVVGQPDSLQLDNIFNFALASEYTLSKKTQLVAEVLANTSSLAGDENNTSPEISTGEIVGMLGARYFLTSKVIFALGLNYDNKQAFLIRPGITIKF